MQRTLLQRPGRSGVRSSSSRGNGVARVAGLPRDVSVRPSRTLSGATAPRSRATGLVVRAESVMTASTRDYSPKTTPDNTAAALWRSMGPQCCVCFDVDCTITMQDSLDLLANFMGVEEEVSALTSKAMDGSLSLEQALEERLKIINCNPSDIKRFIQTYPPASRMAPGIVDLIRALQARGVAIYLISGGFRELTLPIAAYLGIPKDHVFANRMNWQWDDETGEPTRLVGFDMSEPTAHNQGKPQAIANIRQRNPYNTVVMIGDGITDLEAVQTTGGADLFIGYGGVVERPAVAAAAQWYCYDYAELIKALARYRVAMIGSGAWASAVVRIIAQNCTSKDDPADEFVDEVRMWVYEEDYEGKKLTEVINTTHENPRYFPGYSLGANVTAVPSIEEAAKDADLLVFCAPHQFMHGICKQLAGKVKPGAAAISLTKGMRVRPEGPQLISQMVRRMLGIDCAVLMGPNIATDIAKEQLSEAVIGYEIIDTARIFRKLFRRPYFKISLLPDPVGAEMCGTLKNIVALGAGMVDGLDLGPNSKATVMRRGLIEMRSFSKALYPTVRDETFLECCGMGDLIATCYGGRNRLVAQAWTKAAVEGKAQSFESLEAELLKGQKLQGVLTSNEVQEILKVRKWEQDYPLFTTINRIINGQLSPTYITDYEAGASLVLPGFESDEDAIAPKRPPKKAVAAVPA
ncbi:hypothetical protein HYH03_009193 [Edaphochlamys debaryana]|uniref:Glycerol-3-phosphate dehydrogenase [NAD(+)] n=1 Tax=Edaphochlamys debaryana TaxID=47281 RepID=A0A835XYE7_9CHLO|nr:hypothetical protein HYH03_009193 [Edaphochlamys debaryana]|eukprot:KAG2492528.1 hypothetical protein HYH03_009193 [Edaphochlamys debaryana]